MAKRQGLTWEQVADRKRRAVAFLRNVVRNDERADEVEGESLESYAARRGLTVSENPKRRIEVATIKELEKEVADLEDCLESVQGLLEAAYEPESSREILAEAIGKALDEIEEALGEKEEEDEEALESGEAD